MPRSQAERGECPPPSATVISARDAPGATAASAGVPWLRARGWFGSGARSSRARGAATNLARCSICTKTVRTTRRSWSTRFLGIYVLGLVPALLISGSLSDRHGRRPLMLVGVAAAVLGSALLAFGPYGAIFLALGRLFSGSTVGIAMAVGSSWLRVTAAVRPGRRQGVRGAPVGAGVHARVHGRRSRRRADRAVGTDPRGAAVPDPHRRDRAVRVRGADDAGNPPDRRRARTVVAGVAYSERGAPGDSRGWS